MSIDQHTPANIAEHVDSAAALIAKHGLSTGTYWAGPIATRYQAGQPIDVVGALAFTYGLDLKHAVDEHFAGVPYFHERSGEYVGEDLHPALAVLMAELGFTQVEQVFEWSDRQQSHREPLVAFLREFATRLRTHGTVLASGGAR